MRMLRRVLALFLVVVLVAVGVVLYYVAHPALPDPAPVREIRYLDQWSQDARLSYYYTPQGTQVKGLRYDWFVALELPFSRQRFARPEYLSRFGFLVEPNQRPNAVNPGNLPVGFTRHQDDETGDQYLDITCAACHTGELHYQGKAVRIDGGAALHSLASTVPTLRGGGFGQALGMSMAFTYCNPIKFERFARQVLGDRFPEGRDKLRADFRSVLFDLLGTAWNDTHRGLYPTQEGFGRTDAFGRIANSVFGDALDPRNYRVADAPVSYPQLWDIWKFDWVQWNGSAMQPMARNIGESLGVGARLQLFGKDGSQLPEAQRYPSSVRLNDIYSLEVALMGLKPPAWPEDILGGIDLERASRGRALFAENCAMCHAPAPKPRDQRLAPARDPEWRMRIVPVDIVGTDPSAADNIADHRFDVSQLGWTPAQLAKLGVKLFDADPATLDMRSLSSAKGLTYVTAYVEQQAYRAQKIPAEQQAKMDGFGLPIGVQEIRGYKARPLDGIWATPPFLHNGSVANLFELLSPVRERQSRFWVGNFEYDPVRVGYRSERFEGGFLLDTSTKGNANSGHEFRDGCRGHGVIGRALAPAERLDLIEYLKVLGDAPLEAKLHTVNPKPWSPGPRCQG
jgi:cytochrome c5